MTLLKHSPLIKRIRGDTRLQPWPYSHTNRLVGETLDLSARKLIGAVWTALVLRSLGAALMLC